MGVSYDVSGFVPPDETWAKMKAAWDACRAAGVEPPDELWNFFGGAHPDEHGMEVDIDDATVEIHNGAQLEYRVEIAKLPKQVQFLVFTISH
jgi:hypothetical protein